MSEVLIFAPTNPQYDSRLFIELQVQYMKIPNSNLGRTCCVQKLFLTFRTIFVHNMFSPCSAKRRVSDKDLPVPPALKVTYRTPPRPSKISNKNWRAKVKPFLIPYLWYSCNNITKYDLNSNFPPFLFYKSF